MTAIPSKYYFRVNTLKAERGAIIRSMIANGLSAEAHMHLDDAAFLHPSASKLETDGVIVEANRFEAEAVQLGAHLYAPGVKRCHGLLPGMKVTVVDEGGRAVGSGESHQSGTSILTNRKEVAEKIKNSKTGLPSRMETPGNL